MSSLQVEHHGFGFIIIWQLFIKHLGRLIENFGRNGGNFRPESVETMKLSLKSLSITVAVLWGAIVFLVAIANLIWPPYGAAFLNTVSSVYPGYEVIDEMALP